MCKAIQWALARGQMRGDAPPLPILLRHRSHERTGHNVANIAIPTGPWSAPRAGFMRSPRERGARLNAAATSRRQSHVRRQEEIRRAKGSQRHGLDPRPTSKARRQTLRQHVPRTKQNPNFMPPLPFMGTCGLGEFVTHLSRSATGEPRERQGNIGVSRLPLRGRSLTVWPSGQGHWGPGNTHPL